mmetsp:Transcript_56620/g.165587  ORF Transcript_56620/g.165587 Transcript_56620/m.165587 type:complete len:501 (+) Transcript_56620:80-1582(+)
MPPKAKAKGKAKAAAKVRPEAKAKGKARAEPKSPARAKAAPTPASPAKRKAEAPASSPALKRSKTAEALEKAKAAASSGGNRRGGARAVDSRVPNASNLKVVEEYSVKLNQTHIDANNNKYYIIQVLEGDGKYFAWNRWGRVGEPGQNKLMPCATVDMAIKEFEKKFREKTVNQWANRANFKAVNGKYHIVETEESGGGGQDQAPMGKLTEAQIGKGQAVLEQIQAEMKKRGGDAKKLEVLSSEFYTLIPHNFGRNRPPAIVSDDMLQAKMELLKFYLRMGFEEIEEEAGITPVSGVMQLALPKSLNEAATGLCTKGDIDKSSKKGEELAKKQAGKPSRKMEAPLYGSIMLYTANAIYRDLNQCLRDENRAKLRKYFKYLRLFFESMACLPKRKVTLWRGLSVDLHGNSQYKVGNTVTWWGVSSCTADINVAKNFAKGCGGKCTIITVESETASDISQITFYSNEKESLLCPGTQLQVKSNKMNGNVCEITLKEVGRVIG